MIDLLHRWQQPGTGIGRIVLDIPINSQHKAVFHHSSERGLRLQHSHQTPRPFITEPSQRRSDIALA